MNLAIRVIAILGAVITAFLVFSNLFLVDKCPLFMTIPACYLVEIAFIDVFISTLKADFKYKQSLFFIGFFIGEVNGIYFSYNQLIGNKICPTYFGIPLCYVSLLTFSVLLALKILELRKK